MFRVRRSLPLFFSASAASIAFVIACTKEVRPPVSDGPGNGSEGQGGGENLDGGDGGIARVFASFADFNPTGLAADGDTLYVTLAPVDTTQPGEVVVVSPAGAVTVLVNTAVSPSAPVVNGGALYYVDTPAGVPASAILRLDLSNVSDGSKVLVSGVDHPSAIVVTGASVVVASSAGGTGVQIDSVSTSGGTTNPITSVGGEFSPAGVASDGTNVYFAARATGGGEIASVPLNAGSADPIWSGSDTGSLGAVVVANSTVYFTLTADPNSVVYSVPTEGGLANPIATALTQPSGLAVNGAYVYYTLNSAEGAIYRAVLDPDSGIAPTQLATVSDSAYLVLGATAVYATTDHAVVRVAQ